MLKYIYFCFALFLLFSCSRSINFYNLKEAEYDKEKAIQMINEFEEGTLVVQIPCEKQRQNVFQNMIKNESDPEKKAQLSAEYDNFKLYLLYIHQSMVEAVKSEYTFSKYIFVPDTLIKKFKLGMSENIVLDDQLQFIESYEHKDSGLKLYLRGHRDYDHLYLYDLQGDLPPEPFPSRATLGTLESPAIGTYSFFDRLTIQKAISWGIANLNKKLHNFQDNP